MVKTAEIQREIDQLNARSEIHEYQLSPRYGYYALDVIDTPTRKYCNNIITGCTKSELYQILLTINKVAEYEMKERKAKEAIERVSINVRRVRDYTEIEADGGWATTAYDEDTYEKSFDTIEEALDWVKKDCEEWDIKIQDFESCNGNDIQINTEGLDGNNKPIGITIFYWFEAVHRLDMEAVLEKEKAIIE